jgi:hypothetical protein
MAGVRPHSSHILAWIGYPSIREVVVNGRLVSRVGSSLQNYPWCLKFLHISELRIGRGRYFAVLDQAQLNQCQPRTLVRGSGFLNPRERSGIKIQGFSPGGGASNSIPRDADDQANSSGLSLKPAPPD